MGADLTSGRDVDGEHRDGVCQVNGNLFSLLVFNHGNLLTSTLVTAKEFSIPTKADRMIFCSIRLNIVDNVMRLNDFDQKNGNDMSRVLVEPFMVFLSLEYVNEVSSLNRNGSDVVNLILSLLFVIWWVWDFKLLLVSGLVYLAESKLGEAMFEADSVESDGSHLDTHGALVRPTCVDLLKERFFDYEFLH